MVKVDRSSAASAFISDPRFAGSTTRGHAETPRKRRTRSPHGRRSWPTCLVPWRPPEHPFALFARASSGLRKTGTAIARCSVLCSSRAPRRSCWRAAWSSSASPASAFEGASGRGRIWDGVGSRGLMKSPSRPSIQKPLACSCSFAVITLKHGLRLNTAARANLDQSPRSRQVARSESYRCRSPVARSESYQRRSSVARSEVVRLGSDLPMAHS